MDTGARSRSVGCIALSAWLMACGNAQDRPVAAATETGSTGDTTDDPVLPDMGLQPPSICEQVCATRGACGQSEISCLNACDADYGIYTDAGDECSLSFLALLTCVANLDCDSLQLYDNPPEDTPYPCEVEDDEFTLHCLLGGEPPPTTCDAYCEVVAMCESEVSPNDCAAICSAQLTFAEGLGEECRAATAAQLECVGTLDCSEYEAFNEQEGEYPCKAESELVEDVCGM